MCCEKTGKFRPRVRGTHVDNPDGFDPRLWRFDTEEARGLAAGLKEDLAVPLRPTGALAATSVCLIRNPVFKPRKSRSEESSAHDRSTNTLSQPLLPGESMPNDGGEIIVLWFPPERRAGAFGSCNDLC